MKSLTHFHFKPLISMARRSNILAIISLLYFVFVDIFCVKLDRSVYVRIKENNIYGRCLSARRLTVKTSHRKEVKVFFPDTCRRLFASPIAIKNRRCGHFLLFLINNPV